ncbi:MAG: Gx transporter family protein [Ruminococcaceae bacterium]|nr:Gx transporter family protein [Oscillospiraceae bacterium]
MRTKRLALCALYTAIALTIFVLETQIPPLLPVPGVKLGLSNIVTLFALCSLGGKEACAIVLVRIVLGNLATGQVSAIFYSLGGGMLSFFTMLLAMRIVKSSQIWVVGVLGGIAHNIGQICVAVLLTQTVGLFVYLPMLLLCGIATGALTGLCAQILKNRRIFQ